MDAKEKIFWTLLHYSTISNFTAASQKKYAVMRKAEHLRFGNFYITLRNFFTLALYFGVDKVFVDNSPLIGKEEGMFFFDGTFASNAMPECLPGDAMLISIDDSEALYYLFKKLALIEAFSKYERQAKDILHKNLVYRRVDLPQNAIVAHLRGGDVFSAKPHPGYGQPPLAWYKYCIDFHKNRLGTEVSVIVVHEDDKNPCLGGIVSFCQERGIAVAAQSGKLQEDYGYLMHASCLIDSIGTFTYPAKDLSQSLETLYSFNYEYCNNYIVRNKWRATQDQLDRMVKMSVDELCIPDDLYRQSINRDIDTIKNFNPLYDRYYSWL